ncbi:MAG: ATP-binding cassette domain-containing protein [Thermoplasmataceae archaeon]
MSFSVDRGVTLLVGENGAGKSTLVSILEGLSRPTSGNLYLNSINPARDARKVMMETAFIPENPIFFPSVNTVSEYFHWYSRFRGISMENIKDMAQVFGIENSFRKNLRMLSQGERQIVQLVAALSSNVENYVLDEPNASLDVGRREALSDLISWMSKNEGSNFLVTSHIIDELLPISDYVITMERGSIISKSHTDELIKNGRKAVYLYGINPNLLIQDLKENGFEPQVVGKIVFVECTDLGKLIGSISKKSLETLGSARTHLALLESNKLENKRLDRIFR